MGGSLQVLLLQPCCSEHSCTCQLERPWEFPWDYTYYVGLSYSLEFFQLRPNVTVSTSTNTCVTGLVALPHGLDGQDPFLSITDVELVANLMVLNYYLAVTPNAFLRLNTV